MTISNPETCKLCTKRAIQYTYIISSQRSNIFNENIKQHEDRHFECHRCKVDVLTHRLSVIGNKKRYQRRQSNDLTKKLNNFDPNMLTMWIFYTIGAIAKAQILVSILSSLQLLPCTWKFKFSTSQSQKRKRMPFRRRIFINNNKLKLKK